jgi:creatinine amidohydrolase
MMKRLLVISVFFLFSTGTAVAQIYRVAQMNADQVRSLDRGRTVVILTGGILEQHGPHLPTFSDGYSNEWLAQKLAEEVVRRPGMSVLMFPTIPLGHEGANELGATFVYPGTYSVRRKTLRSIFMDIATELGEQGFKWVFIFHGHGAPFHNLMLDQAGDYFREAYGGRMVHLRGLQPTAQQIAQLNLAGRPDSGLSDSDKKEVGNMDEHAGFDETSRILFLRPDLVSPGYTQLRPRTANDTLEFVRAARAPGWLGYLSSPRLANAHYGARVQHHRSQRDNALALAILDGKLDERDIPRYAKMMTGNKQLMSELAESTRNEAERERKQSDWLKKHRIE